MIRISTRLDEGAIIFDGNCSDKAALMGKTASVASEIYGLDATKILDGLEEREKLGPTGFGGGTAIPHCKYDGLDAPVGVFLRLSRPVEYGAVDDVDVDLVFALISPSQDGAAHLRALAEISRMFRDEKSCAQLRGAGDGAALFALLSLDEERSAA